MISKEDRARLRDAPEKSDHKFLVIAREAVPALLDALEAAEARAEKAEDLLAALTSHNPWHFSDCDPSYCIFCDCVEAEEATASEHTPNCDFRLATEYVIKRRRAK